MKYVSLKVASLTSCIVTFLFILPRPATPFDKIQTSLTLLGTTSPAFASS